MSHVVVYWALCLFTGSCLHHWGVPQVWNWSQIGWTASICSSLFTSGTAFNTQSRRQRWQKIIRQTDKKRLFSDVISPPPKKISKLDWKRQEKIRLASLSSTRNVGTSVSGRWWTSAGQSVQLLLMLLFNYSPEKTSWQDSGGRRWGGRKKIHIVHPLREDPRAQEPS